VGLAQLIKLLVVELIQPYLNPRFDMGVAFTVNYSFSSDVSVDSEALLVTDFVNFKIKLVQSFEDAHRGRVCVHVFIGGKYSYVYGYLYLYCVPKKNFRRLLKEENFFVKNTNHIICDLQE
jgi:hypothetical protein